MVQRVNDRYGLNDPLPTQFVNFWKRTVTGDLGESFKNRRDVNDILAERAAASIRLGFWAITIEVIVGISVGLLSAIRRYSLSDKLTTVITAAA